VDVLIRQPLTDCGRSPLASPPFRPERITTDRFLLVKPPSWSRCRGRDFRSIA
jgi:hypothetical protein